MSAVVVPAYLGEVAPARLRGRIVEVYEVMLCLGMLSAILIDAALQHAPYNWRWMVGAPILPALVLACKSSITEDRELVCKLMLSSVQRLGNEVIVWQISQSKLYQVS